MRTSARAAFWTLILGSLSGLAIYALKLLDDSGAVRLESVSPPLAELVRQHAEVVPAPPSTLAVGLDPAIDRAILHMLWKAGGSPYQRAAG